MLQPPSNSHVTASPSPQAWLEDLARQTNAAGIEKHMQSVAAASRVIQELASVSLDDRIAEGFGHTLREIVQQPLVWADTALRSAAFARDHFPTVFQPRRFASVCLTGSGSSHYAAELAAPSLESALAIPVRAIGSGDFLSCGTSVLPPGPVLLVSLARSGNSPESTAVLRVVMRERPDTVFLNITCNAGGKLATEYAADSRVHSLLLHPATHDQSLVMTSSFSSMALALIGLAHAHSLPLYLDTVAQLSIRSLRVMPVIAETLAQLPFHEIRRALFLGSQCQFGAAREAALKLTEMTAGRIVSLQETFLGVRHGPMAVVDGETLVVALLPPESRSRRYALDLLAEFRRKRLGRVTLVADQDLLAADTGEWPESAPPPDATGPLPGAFAALMDVLTGQWLGFFACRHHGLHPDAPAASGVITRVVQPFPLYH